MTIPLAPLLIGATCSAFIFSLVAIVAFRKTRTVYPIRCVHCWMHEEKETIVSYSPRPDLWAICPDCVEYYWHFDQQFAAAAGERTSRPS